MDINARIVAQFAEKYLGQSIQVVNKVGGSGMIGMKEWISSKPDGEMLGVMTNAGITDPLLVKDAPYKTEQIQPIVQVAYEPNVLVVLPGSRTDKPIKDLMAWIKSQPPETVKCGVGSLWTGQDFTRASMDFYGGFQMARVGFGGGAPNVTALLGGHIDLSVPYVSEVISHVKSGALKAIAVAGPERSKALPDVPTFTESGWPDVSWGVFRMIAVPKETPKEIVTAYEDVLTKTLKDPNTVAAYEKAGLEVVYRNTVDSEKYLQSELTRHKGLIDKLGVKPQ
ncbi:MAG: Bug family tripartite tricarboxylate transporter substrate binding protein [Chloroflexota bacterium]